MTDLNDDALLIQTLHAVQELRSETSHLFEQLGDGVQQKEEKPAADQSKVFITDLQQSLMHVYKHFQDLEKMSATLNPMGNALTAGNCYSVTLDPILDKTPLFTKLLQSYKWWNKAHDVANQTTTLLSQNLLKRSSQTMMAMNKRTRKTAAASHSVQNHLVDTLITSYDRLFPDMSISLHRPMGNAAVLKVTLGRVLIANIVLRGLIIESVFVKAFGEDLQYDSIKEELWAPSRYQVFQKVTDHTNAAMLHFYSPLIPELAIRSFMTWLHSYTTLFTSPCHKCGKYLQDNLPPTWRDFRSLDAYHDGCRQ